MSIKLWTGAINGLFLWSTTINKAFLGTVEIFSTSLPNWLLTDLLSYWKADTNWSYPDAHWSNPWTINWATFDASWKINWDYNWDGINDNIDFWNTTLSSSTLSISLWAKLGADTGAQQWIISQESWTLAANSSFFLRWINVSSTTWYWDFWYRDTSWWFPVVWDSTPIAIPTSAYVHLVVVQDTPWGTLKLYVDNVLNDTIVIGLNRANNTTNLRMMCRAWWTSSCVNGKIDETWIWNTALTSDDVSALYNAWAWLSFDNFTT